MSALGLKSGDLSQIWQSKRHLFSQYADVGRSMNNVLLVDYKDLISLGEQLSIEIDNTVNNRDRAIHDFQKMHLFRGLSLET